MNIPEGWALELGECVDGDSYASVSPDPSACGELIYRSRNPVVFAFLLALRAAAPPAPAARQLHSFSSIDCEALIAAVLPGGSICDPQQVADSIRSYLNAWPPAPAAQSAQTDPGAQEG